MAPEYGTAADRPRLLRRRLRLGLGGLLVRVEHLVVLEDHLAAEILLAVRQLLAVRALGDLAVERRLDRGARGLVEALAQLGLQLLALLVATAGDRGDRDHDDH